MPVVVTRLPRMAIILGDEFAERKSTRMRKKHFTFV